MRMAEVFRFEFGYQARRVWTWLLFVVVAVFAFQNTRDTSVADALYEDYYVNSLFALAVTTVIGTVMWLMAAAVVAGGAAARDVETRMAPLVYTAPLTTAEYLGGRFLAALALNALLLLAVQVGASLAVYWPGVPPERIGPFGPAPFLIAYAVISLPNAFFATAVQFWLASRSGRPLAGYLGSVALLFMGTVVASLLLYYRDVGSLLDPVGMRYIIEDLAHEWTPAERRTRLLLLEGTVLWNRLLWLGIGLAALAATAVRFRFAHRSEPGRWWRCGRKAQDPAPQTPSVAGSRAPASAPVAVGQGPRTFGVATRTRQTLAIAWDSFRAVGTGRVGLALAVFLPALAFITVAQAMVVGDVPRVPTAALVLSELTASLTDEMSNWVILPLFLIYVAGEVVWRERDAGLGEMVDAAPVPEWARLIGSVLALGLVLALWMGLLAVGGMLAQTYLGYRTFDVGLYLGLLFGLQLPEYLLFGVLALVVHVVANQKVVGHLLVVVAYAFIAVPHLFGVESELFVYGSGPAWSYTELRGFGVSLAPWVWYKAYWAAWAVLLAAGARLLWAHGRDEDLRARLRLARRRFTRPTTWTVAAAAGLVLLLGGAIHYNTAVLNTSYSSSEYDELLAEYERRYGRYEGVPQPRLAATQLHVEIDPERRTLEVRGTYLLVNRSAATIDSVHLAIVPGAENGTVTFDRAAAPVLTDDLRGHRIYALERPLQPGDSLALGFEVRVEPRGFGTGGTYDAVVPNGTFFTNTDWLPQIGYQPRRELTAASDRRDHGLPPRPVIASLEDAEARRRPVERTTLDVVVGTSADQVPVAPGDLVRTWTEGDRHYAHYVTDGEIGNDYAVFSADYAVREARWTPSADSGKAVTIRVYHHPSHTANVDRILRNARASLDVYSRAFGPYPYDHLTFVEVRGNELGMHADPTLIRFSEETALLNPWEEDLDLPAAIVAHEVAHQWWGHGLEPARVEGAPVLGEGLAEYSAIAVVNEALGRDQLRRFLANMRKPYPYAPIHRGDPLLRGLDPYLAYRKAPLALRTMSEAIGSDRVNQALRRLREEHPSGATPLATTLDLYRELTAVTPDSLRPLLHDLFEVNTTWDFAVERAAAVETARGWRVTLDVRVRKTVTDSAGVETEVPAAEWVQVGVFGAHEDGGDALSQPLYLRTHRLRSGTQTITLVVQSRPVRAGIDPFHVLDWEGPEDDDNVERVRSTP